MAAEDGEVQVCCRARSWWGGGEGLLYAWLCRDCGKWDVGVWLEVGGCEVDGWSWDEVFLGARRHRAWAEWWCDGYGAWAVVVDRLLLDFQDASRHCY